MTNQIQLKISLSEQLNALLIEKADHFGVPVTQYVKFVIMKDVEADKYPTLEASDRTEKIAAEALESKKDSVVVNDVDAYFESL